MFFYSVQERQIKELVEEMKISQAENNMTSVLETKEKILKLEKKLLPILESNKYWEYINNTITARNNTQIQHAYTTPQNASLPIVDAENVAT